MPVKYAATIPQPQWNVGARIVLDLRIDNLDSRDFTFPDPGVRNSPQPHFELTVPGGKRLAFQPWSRFASTNTVEPVSLVRVEPRGSWQGTFALTGYADLSRPGRYRLRSWLDDNGARIESPTVEFEVLPTVVHGLATELSVGDDGSRVVECVQLLAGGEVVTSIMTERDPANAELLPFERLPRGATEATARGILAPYSNFSVGLSPIRWIVAEVNRGVVVSTSLSTNRVALFNGSGAVRVLPPVATTSALHLCGIHAAAAGAEVLVARVHGAGIAVDASASVSLARFDRMPDAGAMALSPVASGNRLLYAFAFTNDAGMQLTMIASAENGESIVRTEHAVAGWHPTGNAAAYWSSQDEIRIAVLGRDIQQPRRIALIELHLGAEQNLRGATKISAGMTLDTDRFAGTICCFEPQAGRVSVAAVARAPGGDSWVVTSDAPPRRPMASLPPMGPLALLPGRTHWYVAWPEGAGMRIDGI